MYFRFLFLLAHIELKKFFFYFFFIYHPKYVKYSFFSCYFGVVEPRSIRFLSAVHSHQQFLLSSRAQRTRRKYKKKLLEKGIKENRTDDYLISRKRKKEKKRRRWKKWIRKKTLKDSSSNLREKFSINFKSWQNMRVHTHLRNDFI